MREGRTGALFGALVIAIVACSAPPASSDGPIARASSAIVFGDASPPSQDFVVEVVHPVSSRGAFVCSGSLVAPNLVLTARHCVSATSNVGFTCDSSGDGTDGGAIGPDYDPSSVYIYAGSRAPTQFTTPSATAVRFFHDDATNVCNHDLALIELRQPITGVKVGALDLASTPAAGQTITTVGWGVTADGGAPGLRQERGGVAIVAVGPADVPSGYAVGPAEFDVGESICVGDSGGPALDSSNAIVGVVSRGGNDAPPSATNPAVGCLGRSTVNFYTETAPYKDFILGVFKTVGATPVLGGAPMDATAPGSGCTLAAADARGDGAIFVGAGLLMAAGRRRGRRRRPTSRPDAPARADRRASSPAPRA